MDDQVRREKARIASNKWRKENPEKVKAYLHQYYQTDKYKISKRNSKYLAMYGVSLEQYNEMLNSQKGVCAICHNPETVLGKDKKIKNLSIDHCHSTGNVRGLLCNSCNNLIGRCDDNVSILQNAISYLNKYKAKQ